MDDFEKEMQEAFVEEASQLITDAEKQFLDLEHTDDKSTILEEIFRLAHNIKGPPRRQATTISRSSPMK